MCKLYKIMSKSILQKTKMHFSLMMILHSYKYNENLLIFIKYIK